jgi:amidohydrolase
MPIKYVSEEILNLRKKLHTIAEVSGNEKQTSDFLINYFHKLSPSQIITGIGGYGFVVIFEGANPGKSIALRTDIDALPITEENTFAYKSVTYGVSHKCGHDGHMAILTSVGEYFAKNPIKKGKLILLFQPEEETGTGALKMLNDEKFKKLQIDYLFGLHNLPGYETSSIICRKNTFASASVGLILKLLGKTSHAAEPENGNSPALAMAEIVQSLEKLVYANTNLKDFALLTTIHAKLGEKAFGTTPGYAEVMATLRAYKNRDLELLKNESIKNATAIADKYSLKLKSEFTEEFSATVNSPEMVNIVKEAALNNNLNYHRLKNPFRWSEDFGYFLQKYKGAMFGLGAGKNHPQLHNPDYDFPDEIIDSGAKMFISIVNNLQQY